MADETQNAPVAGAQTATQNAEVDTSVKAQEESLKKNFPTLIGYLYMSDPDNANPLWHHYVMPVFDEKAYEELPWHVYKERPSDDLVDPLYSVQKGGWIENAHDAQAQILAQAQAQIAQLSQNNQIHTEQSEMLTKALANVTAGQESTQKLIMAMQKTMLQIVGQNKATESTDGNEPPKMTEQTGNTESTEK